MYFAGGRGRMAFRELLNVSERSEKVADLGVVPRVTMASAPRNVPRIDYERIFVLDGEYNLLSEYVLNDGCPLDFDDLWRSIPLEGLRHGKPVFQGEYVFTPFIVDDLQIVILTRGAPRIEERGFIGAILAAAKIHLGKP